MLSVIEKDSPQSIDGRMKKGKRVKTRRQLFGVGVSWRRDTAKSSKLKRHLETNHLNIVGNYATILPKNKII